MPRIQMTFPSETDKKLREEALRRIRGTDDAGRRTGSVVRDLVLGCILLAFEEVRQLSKAELDELLRRPK